MSSVKFIFYKEFGQEIDSYALECSPKKFFGSTLIDEHNQLIRLGRKDYPAITLTFSVDQVFMANKRELFYLTTEGDLFRANCRENSIVGPIHSQLRLASFTGQYKVKALIVDRNQEASILSFSSANQVATITIKNKIPTNVINIQLLVFGPLYFIALLNHQHHVLIYLLDSHHRMKAVASVEKVLMMAEYDGRLYFLKTDERIYAWGSGGQYVYADDIQVIERYGTSLVYDRSSWRHTYDGSSRCYTLLEYIKYMERKSSYHLELMLPHN